MPQPAEQLTAGKRCSPGGITRWGDDEPHNHAIDHIHPVALRIPRQVKKQIIPNEHPPMGSPKDALDLFRETLDVDVNECFDVLACRMADEFFSHVFCSLHHGMSLIIKG